MTWWLIGAGYLAQTCFNTWAINRSWFMRFGRLTRGEWFTNFIFGIMPAAGLIIALVSLAEAKWQNRWSAFWNKRVRP